MLWSRVDVISKLSVNVNGMLVTFPQASKRLAAFARPMIFKNEDKMVEVSSRGTCLLAKIMTRNFLIATAHQLKEGSSQRTANEICITSPDNPQLLLTPSDSVRIKFPDSEAPYLEDLIFLEFRPKNYSTDPSAAFVTISPYKTLQDIDIASIKFVYALGYPTEYRGIQFNDDPEDYRVLEYKSTLIKLYLNIDGPSPAFERHWRAYVHPDTKIELVDFDGYSGSPVFFVYETEGRQHHLGFAGIVRTASNGIVHFYDGGEILRYIAQSIEEHG